MLIRDYPVGAEEITAAMHANGVSQSDISTALGVHRSTVSLWFAGKRSITLETYNAILKLVGIDGKECGNGRTAQ